MSVTEATVTGETGRNYAWWQNAGWEWYAELRLRRLTKPIYEMQETYLSAFFRAKAEEWLREKGRPLTVLEFGCGFGRHLKYLRQIKGLEAYGCDQSPAMLSAARTLLCGRFPEMKERLVEVEPKGRLPYPDKAFDVVFTVSVLIHISPEDLGARVAELRRVAGHMVLNLELPSVTRSFLWDEAHGGCWLHDFVGAHGAAGPCRVEVDADALSPIVTVYRAYVNAPAGAARVLKDGQWAEEPRQVEIALAEAALAYGRSCRDTAQETTRDTGARLKETIEALRQRIADMRGTIRDTNRQLTALRQSRAVRAAQWLGMHRILSRVVVAGFDAASGLRRQVLRLLGRRAVEPSELVGAGHDTAGPAASAGTDAGAPQAAAPPDSGGREAENEHGYQ